MIKNLQKNLKNRKEKGFTLVELVVVIAIIAILAAVLIPQITGYIKDSRKTEVIQEAREIVTAVDSTNSKQGSGTLADSASFADVLANKGAAALINAESIDKIADQSVTIEQLRNLLKSDEYTFDLNDDDTLNISSIETIN